MVTCRMWNNRYQVTHCKLLGLYDINTENTRNTANMMDHLPRAGGQRRRGRLPFPRGQAYRAYRTNTTIPSTGIQSNHSKIGAAVPVCREVLQDSISRDSDYAKPVLQPQQERRRRDRFRIRPASCVPLNSKNLNAGTLTDWSNSGQRRAISPPRLDRMITIPIAIGNPPA